MEEKGVCVQRVFRICRVTCRDRSQPGGSNGAASRPWPSPSRSSWPPDVQRCRPERFPCQTVQRRQHPKQKPDSQPANNAPSRHEAVLHQSLAGPPMFAEPPAPLSIPSKTDACVTAGCSSVNAPSVAGSGQSTANSTSSKCAGGNDWTWSLTSAIARDPARFSSSRNAAACNSKGAWFNENGIGWNSDAASTARPRTRLPTAGGFRRAG